MSSTSRSRCTIRPAYVVAGFPLPCPHQQPPIGLTDRDPLRDRVPPESWRQRRRSRWQTKHHYKQRRGRTGRVAGSRRLLRARAEPPRHRRGRRSENPGPPRGARRVRAPSLRRANLLHVGRRLVGGDLRPPQIRIHGPDSLIRRFAVQWESSRSRSWRTDSKPGTPRKKVSRTARPAHEREAVRPALLGAPASPSRTRGLENALRPDERPLQPPLSRERCSPGVAFRDHGSTTRRSISTTERTFPTSETSNPAEFPQARRERAPGPSYRNCAAYRFLGHEPDERARTSSRRSGWRVTYARTERDDPHVAAKRTDEGIGAVNPNLRRT